MAIKCPQCSSEAAEYRFHYICTQGHEWDERVRSADSKSLPPAELPGVKAEPPKRTFVMPFGKHRGEDIADLPTDYLNWMVENLDNKPELVREAENQLAMRAGRGVVR